MGNVINSGFVSPYPDACPAWCREGALVKTTVKRKSFLMGEYDDPTVYEVVSIHPLQTPGIWGLAYLRPKGSDARWTAAEYICDLEEVTGA